MTNTPRVIYYGYFANGSHTRDFIFGTRRGVGTSLKIWGVGIGHVSGLRQFWATRVNMASTKHHPVTQC